jgi:hypothetical protein
MQGIEIDEDLADRVNKGYQPVWRDLSAYSGQEELCDGQVKLVCRGKLMAIASLKMSKGEGTADGYLKIERVFS